jgi:hypothetical protein
VEYCQEDTIDFICNSTGDPCGAGLTCDEASDVCDVSDVTVIVADAYGYSGTIDIELDNPLDSVSEVRVDICDRDQRSWLAFSAVSCSNTPRSSAFACAVTDIGNGCVGVDITSGVAGLIDPGTGAIAQLTYTIDPSTPPGDYADVTPENSDVRDDTATALLVTPKPGKVGTLECIDAADCDDLNVCTNDACVGNVCQYTNNVNPCDDGIFCNGTDSCRAGICSEHTGDPCAGGAECNSSCQELTDTCFDTSGTACTDDGNECTDDTCDGGGVCAHPNNTASCDDLIACTEIDTCSGGVCNGTPNNSLCFDDDICTDDLCTVGAGCSNPNNTAPCDDGLYCTENDQCSGGTCASGSQRTCDDTISCTDDSCNEGTDSCDNVPNNGLCDNALWCDGVEICDAIADCQDGPDPACGVTGLRPVMR